MPLPALPGPEMRYESAVGAALGAVAGRGPRVYERVGGSAPGPVRGVEIAECYAPGRPLRRRA